MSTPGVWLMPTSNALFDLPSTPIVPQYEVKESRAGTVNTALTDYVVCKETDPTPILVATTATDIARPIYVSSIFVGSTKPRVIQMRCDV